MIRPFCHTCDHLYMSWSWINIADNKSRSVKLTNITIGFGLIFRTIWQIILTYPSAPTVKHIDTRVEKSIQPDIKPNNTSIIILN